jgi:hypothetical protein
MHKFMNCIYNFYFQEYVATVPMSTHTHTHLPAHRTRNVACVTVSTIIPSHVTSASFVRKYIMSEFFFRKLFCLKTYYNDEG